jgi:hypothetical protein
MNRSSQVRRSGKLVKVLPTEESGNIRDHQAEMTTTVGRRPQVRPMDIQSTVALLISCNCSLLN